MLLKTPGSGSAVWSLNQELWLSFLFASKCEIECDIKCCQNYSLLSEWLGICFANSFIGVLAIALLGKRRIPISSLHLLQGWYSQRLLSNELKDRWPPVLVVEIELWVWMALAEWNHFYDQTNPSGVKESRYSCFIVPHSWISVRQELSFKSLN